VTSARLALAVLLTFACAAPMHGDAIDHARSEAPRPRDSRLALIHRAQVWRPTDVAARDLWAGPRDPRGFAPHALVPCRYVPKTMNGHSPKFACLLSKGDEVKVKYGGTNGEVYGEVLATRLLWALGFGADRIYPVRVLCHGCPPTIGNIALPHGERMVAPAAIERKMPGREIDEGGAGWAWTELDETQPASGGATRAERDALKLLAVFMQHTDSKPQQQRLVCLDPQPPGSKGGHCEHPFMMLNDVGLTFGRANFSNSNALGSVDLAAWSRTPVWSGETGCTAWLPKSHTGTLDNPVISEDGRAFLASLLMRLSDAQLHDLFAVARVDIRPRDPSSGRSGFPTVDEWVAAFKVKRAEIVNRRCG
jgi:hypothetical protein